MLLGCPSALAMGVDGVFLLFTFLGRYIMKLSSIIAIEIATAENANVLFGPTNTKLRGRWSGASRSLRGMTSDAGMNQMPDLPGQQLILDTNKKTFTVHDPLGDPDYMETLDSANSVLKAVFGAESKPDKDYEIDVEDSTAFKTALYWLRRLLDANQARLISGEVPLLADIRKSVKGDIRKGFWNSFQNDYIEEDESEGGVAVKSSPPKATSSKPKKVSSADTVDE
jgi:hypothetical protein